MFRPVGDTGGKNPTTRTAFTLLELLVVIAIIALLLGILLPSLQNARVQGKKAACLAHVKGIGTSARVYESDDPNGWGIPVHWKFYAQTGADMKYVGAYEWGGKSGVGRPNFLGPPKPTNSKYGTRAGFGPAERPMNDLLYPGGFTNYRLPVLNETGALRDTKLDLDLFKCPADDGPPRGAHCPNWVANAEQSSFDHFGTSFSANIFMTYNGWGEWGELGFYQPQPIFSNSPYLRPLSRVPTPMRTIFFEENIGRWAWAVKQDPCDDPPLPGINPGPTKSVRGWHGQDWTYSRSFVDGHAEFQRVYIDGTEDAQGFANHYRTEALDSYPPLKNIAVATFDHYKCIIVRGPGWQKDTLPAQRIQTHLVDHDFTETRVEYEDCVN